MLGLIIAQRNRVCYSSEWVSLSGNKGLLLRKLNFHLTWMCYVYTLLAASGEAGKGEDGAQMLPCTTASQYISTLWNKFGCDFFFLHLFLNKRNQKLEIKTELSFILHLHTYFLPSPTPPLLCSFHNDDDEFRYHSSSFLKRL